MLADLLASDTRAAVLTELFGQPGRELHLRDLIRATGFSPRSVQQEVTRLTRIGLIEERRSGNRRYLRAANGHPLFRSLADIVRMTTGAPALLRSQLSSDDRIRLALLFGSLAAGTERATSDVDLLVVGSLSLRELLALLAPLRERLGREINPVLMTEAEFATRRAGGEHFVASVLASDPVTLVGTLGGDR